MTITVCKYPVQETFKEAHIWNPWSSIEIFRCTHKQNDGSIKRYYSLYCDGDHETDVKTIKEARKYVNDLRDSWLENHPGEKAPWPASDKL